jgi:hypothetical protein
VSAAGPDIYEPPTQSRRGQLIDSVIILVLLFAVLFGVTYYTESSGSSSAGEPKPISQLPITPTEKQQYQRLVDEGITDLEGVNEQVANNRPRDDKYTFGIGAAVLTFGVIGAYLLFVYVMSFKEYREVIRERFGPPGEDASTMTRSEVGP